jgi:hypothetical protein
MLYERERRCPRLDGTTLARKLGQGCLTPPFALGWGVAEDRASGLETGGRVKKAAVCRDALEIAPPSSL